jgi:hypothetical protein
LTIVDQAPRGTCSEIPAQLPSPDHDQAAGEADRTEVKRRQLRDAELHHRPVHAPEQREQHQQQQVAAG